MYNSLGLALDVVEGMVRPLSTRAAAWREPGARVAAGSVDPSNGEDEGMIVVWFFSFGLHVDPFLSSVSNLPQDLAADCWWRAPCSVCCCCLQSLTGLSRHTTPQMPEQLSVPLWPQPRLR